jgi:hypothetical protein
MYQKATLPDTDYARTEPSLLMVSGVQVRGEGHLGVGEDQGAGTGRRGAHKPQLEGVDDGDT